MTRQVQQLNYSSFSGGLITEASPLTFPDGASIEENNFELTKQGTRNRRLGLDVVSNEVKLSDSSYAPKDITTFLWDNNGSTGQEFLVTAIRNEVIIYDVTNDSPGDKPLYQTTISGGERLSLASHAGQLVIANGGQDLTIIRAIGDDLFAERTERLKIRDRVGIPAFTRDLSPGERKISLLNAAKAGYRPTTTELYLDPSYVTDPPITPVAPVDVFYDFVGAKLLTTNSTQTRYELESSLTFESFQGFPIDTFVLEKAGTGHFLNIIFREGFQRGFIAAPNQSGNFTVVDGSVKYQAPITETEYNEYLNLTKILTLSEQNAEHHPHIYNLWNQGWGEMRMTGGPTTTLIHPIDDYHTNAKELPASSDNINSVLYPNNQNDSNRTADRFHWRDLQANPQGSSVAPQGHYIIDALDRGADRGRVFLADLEEKGSSRLSNTKLNFELTNGGATAVAEYAGRIWFAGFSEDSAGSTLPLANKILYGQTSDDNLLSCYQEADPTSKNDSDLVDTDGGWVNIDGIDEVVKLVATDTSLVVFATNGVWVIAGLDGNTFTPTASLVAKITDKGAVNSQNIIQVDSDIFFWSQDGLYHLMSEGFATFKLQPMTKSTINEFVLGLEREDFLGMSGAYDERTDRLMWIVDAAGSAPERRELVYHLAFQAFTVNTYYRGTDATTAKEILSVVRTPQFLPIDRTANIVAGIYNVTAGGNNVVANVMAQEGSNSRVLYTTIITKSDGDYLAFASPVRDDFRDWGLVDAPAHLVTGYVSGGDTSREKQVPRLTTHFNRTETQATETGVLHESSCLVQSQWGWTNSAFAGKWGPSFQAYRLPRPQIRGIGEEIAEGIQVVTSQNKLRGRGKVVSLLFSTEEGKDCQILGWSMIAAANSNV